MSEAVSMIVNRMDGDTAAQICFVNADCANIAYRNADYKRVLNEAEIVFADGIGMKIAGKMLKREIRDNVNGTDMFPLLVKALSGTGKGIYLLGARPGVTDSVKEWIETHSPETDVSGNHHGYFKDQEQTDVIRPIKESGASLLLVAFGAPRQDMWINEHLEQTGVKVAIGVGGLFDFFSGRIPRAPQWMRKMGMEWLYRLIQEPGRMWKRYIIGNVLFLWRVMGEKRRSKTG